MCLILVLESIELEQHKLFSLVYLLLVLLPLMEACSLSTRSPSVGTETVTFGSVITLSSDSSHDSLRLVPEQGTTSPVWQYFSLKVGEDGRLVDNAQVHCKLCSMSVWARSGNTSNLFSHLKNNHKCVHALLKNSRLSH